MVNILPDSPKNLDTIDAVRIWTEQVNASMPNINEEVLLSYGEISDAADGANDIRLNQNVKLSQRELIH